MTESTIKTQVCIVGGGPCGMMLAHILAKNGIEVTILEKWPDFLRDFRGDTIHPSTMEILKELSLLEDFLKLPHEKVDHISGFVQGSYARVADFTKLSVTCPYIAFVPQWDFLNFLASKTSDYPSFHLLMNTKATDLILEDGKVKGVKAQGKESLTIDADLVIAADGRNSIIREKSGLAEESLGAPMDVLWFRLKRNEDDPKEPLACIKGGSILIMIYRGDYWQCGYVIKKGGLEKVKELGLKWFQNELLTLAPFLGSRVSHVQNLDELSLLSVRVDRLLKWYKPGLLCLGDAAHAMSPIGGVGINLAIQDAVAAANVLVKVLKHRKPDEDDLASIQKRREWPTKITQSLQLVLQRQFIEKVLHKESVEKLPLILRLLNRLPALRYFPARMIGIGFRPEHVSSEIS